jgi:murein DD-endopeptidase MepM/ murein hydrolase activator NlpD
MSRDAWLWWLGLGSAGGLYLFARRQLLGSPVEVKGTPTVTPHGEFGASRAGPPAHEHQGIDLAAPVGSHVLAVGDGVIVETLAGLGKVVRKLRLDRSAAWTSTGRRVESIVYADLGTPIVSPGDRVERGDSIALVDKRGFVHIAVKRGEVFFDPSEAGFSYRLSSEV